MRKLMFLMLTVLAGCGLAVAQAGFAPPGDVLGAHLNYGRGCPACHSPHSGASGNGIAKPDGSSSGNTMLWGEDVSSLYGKTIATGGGSYVEVLPGSMSAATPDVNGMLTCLSCHDGNYAPGSMMKNKVYETLPAAYGSGHTIPTLLGNTAAGAESYVNDHPMGLSAKVSCGGSPNWDCSESNGVITMKGASSSRFVANYGFFVKLGSYNKTAVVVCTTCHEPHAMNVVTITKGSSSGLPAGAYQTMFFLRAPYNPNDTNPLSNQTSQFCRQCHADKSNEMNGSSAGTVF